MSRIAILGAGIMGSATALFLARRGIAVTLFDAADAPFSGASRWNEGKIHLGYLYAGDPSLSTARRILPGGLAFKPLTEELIGCSLDPVITPQDDVYLIHRDSVVSADEAARYFAAVAGLIEQQPDAHHYLAPVVTPRPRRLSQAELGADYDSAHIVAGFRVPERSVSTAWVADRFVDAIAAEPRIAPRMSTTIRAVRRTTGADDAPLLVETDAGTEGPFDRVVNALWQGRIAIDASFGLPLPPCWSHRFRLSVFLRTSQVVHAPNAVIATGPFGDIKNYDGRHFYLSWYQAGLIAEGTQVAPPALPTFTAHARARLADPILDRIGQTIRSVAAIRRHAEDIRVEGGWVWASGQGSLADPASTLHRRDKIGIIQAGSYISVDTGKYSTAPWLARELVHQILGPPR